MPRLSTMVRSIVVFTSFLGDVYMERVRYKDIGDRPFDLGSLEPPATPLIEVSRRDTGWRLDIRRLEGIDGEEMVRREVALFGKSPGDGECGPPAQAVTDEEHRMPSLFESARLIVR